MKYVLTLLVLLGGCSTVEIMQQSEAFNKCLDGVRSKGEDAHAARQKGGACCAFAENEVDATFCQQEPHKLEQ